MPDKASDVWWIFTRQTVNVTPAESVLNAASLMWERNFRHLPVLNHQGEILGIISAQDIIDALNLALVSHNTPFKIFDALEYPRPTNNDTPPNSC